MASSGINGSQATALEEIGDWSEPQLPIAVLIICSTRLYSDGLAEMLSRDAGIQVLGDREGFDDAVDAIRETPPDLALVDASGPGGPSTIRQLADYDPTLKILALGVADVAAEVHGCVEAGAIGCVSRRARATEAIRTVKCAVDGHASGSRTACGTRLDGVKDSPTRGSSRRPLTSREAEVLGLIDQGLSNREISQALFIEVATVKNHVHSILRKLNLRRRGQAAAWIRHQDRVPLGL